MVIASLFVWSANANASLIGDEITSTSCCGGGTATIGAGIEFPFPGIIMSFDFGEDTVTVRNLWKTPLVSDYSGSYGYGVFGFTGFDTEILALTLISNTGWSGGFVTPGRHSFTPDSISFNTSGDFSQTVAIGAEAVFRITTRSGAVPTPPTIALLGLGLAAMGYRHRKRA